MITRTLGSLARIVLWIACASGSLVSSVRAAPQEPAGAAFDQTHARWGEVLKACVRDGAFDYAKLKQDRSALDAYLTSVHAVTPKLLEGWSESQRFAFWLNCYNAHCVQKVLDNYPLKSIRKLDGAFGMNTVFDKPFIPMRAHNPLGKDEDLSLSDIEHRILRAHFKDARMHAALCSASKGCAPLLGEPFVGERLEAQLEREMHVFVADALRNHIDTAKSTLAVAETFKWFAEDFEREAKTVKEYLARYAPADKTDFIRASKLEYLAFDWNLNDVAQK